MGDKTGIEWTEATWNPIVGCTHVSAGCDHCYAAREASGRLRNNPTYKGLAVDGRFTGEVRLLPQRLEQPLRWRKPRRIFVNSMSDLFERSVPDEFIAQVFAVMATSYRHTFQLLTKRPGRMRSLLSSERFVKLFDTEYCRIPDWASSWPDPEYSPGRDHLADGPLRNVWLGTSVEDQHWADVRIPELMRTPAAVRFLSCEPLLGPIELASWLWCGIPIPGGVTTYCREYLGHRGPHHDGITGISQPVPDWVIVGGESGPGARPMHPAWARSLRDQCVAAGVPFLYKQWGEWAPIREGWGDWETQAGDVAVYAKTDASAEGHQLAVVQMRRVGKKTAGRVLDGRTWDEYPETVHAAR